MMRNVSKITDERLTEQEWININQLFSTEQEGINQLFSIEQNWININQSFFLLAQNI
jgi:hypothetical protein